MGYVMIDQMQDDFDITEYIDDSLEFINYIIALEKRLEIELSDDFLLLDYFRSAKGLAAKIESQFPQIVS